MAATIYERILSIGDFANDGGQIDANIFGNMVAMYAQGVATAAWIKSAWSMTTAQGAQLDTLLATQPSSGLLPTLLNAKAISQWPDKVRATCLIAQCGFTDFNTEAELKTALGV